MTGIGQANNQSHDAVNWVRKSIQRVHAARLMMSIFRVKPMARAVVGQFGFSNFALR
jgi:hypothetical protein